MRQFHRMKAERPDALLFFRMGDFYEMFFDDAVTASKALEIALTSRSKDKSGEPVPMGQAGEIAVKGVSLMRGYYKVVPEAYLDENGFFRTQDGGWLDEEGYVHWTGRISGMIKTGGANVSPVEIERQLEGYKNLRVGLPVEIGRASCRERV